MAVRPLLVLAGPEDQMSESQRTGCSYREMVARMGVRYKESIPSWNGFYMEGPHLVLNKEIIQPVQTSVQNSRKPNMHCTYITNHLACRKMRIRTYCLPFTDVINMPSDCSNLNNCERQGTALINKIWTIEVPSIMCHKQTQQSEVSSLNHPWGVGPPLNPRTLGEKVETIINHQPCVMSKNGLLSGVWMCGCTCGCIDYLDILLQRRSTGGLCELLGLGGQSVIEQTPYRKS